MIKTNWLVVFSVLGVVALSGCGILKKKQPDATASAAPLTPPPTDATAAVAAATAAPEIVIADESIAAPEDFEDEAFEKVSDKTYKAELGTLKKEIEAP